MGHDDHETLETVFEAEDLHDSSLKKIKSQCCMPDNVNSPVSN